MEQLIGVVSLIGKVLTLTWLFLFIMYGLFLHGYDSPEGEPSKYIKLMWLSKALAVGVILCLFINLSIFLLLF